MIPFQSLIYLYAGMLLESPERRAQFMKFLNGAGTEVEKMLNGVIGNKGVNKGGAVKKDESENTAISEPIEFH